MRCFLPEREFSPVELFAEMPAVVAPEDDYGVGGIGALIEGVENSAYAGIDERYRGQIALDGLSPLLVLDDLFVVALGPGHFFAYGRDVVEVVFIHIGQCHLIDGVHIEVFLRDVPGQVRAEEAAGDEEGLIVVLAKLRDCPVGDLVVAHLPVGRIDGAPVEMGGFGDAVYGPIRGHWVVGFVFLLGREIVLP